MATYVIGDGSGGVLTIFCASVGPIVPASTPTDGTNVMTRLFDLDSGAGAEWNMGFSLRLSANGGSVEGGTATNPVRVDPTGTTTQPVSGTVTANQGGAPWTVTLSAGTAVIGHVVVDSGTVAATQSGTWTVQQGGSNWSVNVAQVGGAALSLGQAAMTASVPVVIASNQTAVPVSQSGTWTVGTNADVAMGAFVDPPVGTVVFGKSGIPDHAYFPIPLTGFGQMVLVSVGNTVSIQGSITGITNSVAITSVDLGTTTDTAATTDAASASLIALFKRSLQQFAVLLSRIPAALTKAGNFKVSLAESTATVSVGGTVGTTADVTAGNLQGPLVGHLVMGKTADTIPKYQPLPLAAGGATVPVSGTLAATIADGALVALGLQADQAATTDTQPASLIALFKRKLQQGAALLGQLPATLTKAGNFRVSLSESTATVSVGGTVSTTADVRPGNIQPPQVGQMIMGRTADATPAYQPLPLAAGGASVVVSGPVAVTAADGALATFGTQADQPATTDVSPASYMSLFKRLLLQTAAQLARLPAALTGKGNFRVSLAESTATVGVSGQVSTTADVTAGNLQGPLVGHLVMGKTADTIPLYQPMPLAAGGGAAVVSGPVASGVAASGNPVLCAGKDAFNAKAYPIPLNQAGASVMVDITANGIATPIALADGFTNPSTAVIGILGELFNGTTWDRQRGNNDGTALASAARTSTGVSAALVNYNCRGVILYLNVTAASGTGGLKVAIYALDPTSVSYVQIAVATTGILATGLYAYELYPGAATAGVVGSGTLQQRLQGSLPRNWLVEVLHSDGSSYTYSVGFSLIL